MSGLFEEQEKRNLESARPLAVRMRPRTLSEFVGQTHFLGEGRLLTRLLQADRLGSLIFFGPPGTGKTSLAEVIAAHTQSRFRRLNAAAAGVKELRGELEAARDRLSTGDERTLLFVDEIHHFNKTQQDVLLPDVEEGVVTLIGATTANPFFSLVSALVSRSHLFEFQPLSADEVRLLILRAIKDPEWGVGLPGLKVETDAIDFLVEVSEGDARRALQALEVGARSLPEGSLTFDLEVAQQSVQRKAVVYDADGDQHYDVASAFIKSMRGSDPDAALYWLARMLHAGEDPRFIARRMLILASEDVGNADPRALLIANAAAQATERLGMPECRIVLAQAVTYLAAAPKSNASYVAIEAALEDVQSQRVVAVPMHLRDRSYAGAKRLGHGEGYEYAHEGDGGWVDQDYLGVEKTYYQPADRGFEAEIRKRMEDLAERRERDGGAPPND